MSNRAATILAVAAVICSLSIYATFAQVPDRADRAIVVEQPAIRFQQELPGRYQVEPLSESSAIVIDTHTGRCWSRLGGGWRDWGSPAEKE